MFRTENRQGSCERDLDNDTEDSLVLDNIMKNQSLVMKAVCHWNGTAEPVSVILD